jgi:hypothetical protein
VSALLGGSQTLWFVSRASGLAVLAAFSAAVVAGVAGRLGLGGFGGVVPPGASRARGAGSGSRPGSCTGR